MALPEIPKTYLEFKNRILAKHRLQHQLSLTTTEIEYANNIQEHPLEENHNLFDAVQKFARIICSPESHSN